VPGLPVFAGFSSGFAFTLTFGETLCTLQAKPQQLFFAVNLGDNRSRIFGVLCSHYRFVEALEAVASFVNGLGHGYFFLAFLAGLRSERLFKTVLLVTSDLIRTIGSSGVPTLVTMPPLGPFTETRLALATL